MRANPPLAVEIEALGFLLGTWQGRGEGSYPTIEPFEYLETVTFSHLGKPFLVYRQGTVHGEDHRPLHGEAGYWRLPEPGRVELVVAHPTGVVEVAEGRLEATTIDLASTFVGCTSSAKEVTAIERHVEVDGDVLRYRLRMAAVGQPMTHHLHAELHRA